MIPVVWQVQAASIPEVDVAIRAPRWAGKTFVLSWIAVMDAIIENRNVVFTSNRLESSRDAYQQAIDAINDLGFFQNGVERVSRANGSQMITFKNGNWIAFVSRSATSGRGFSADTLIFDDADDVSDIDFSNLAPIVNDRENARVVMAGIGAASTGDTPFDRFVSRTEKKFILSLGSVTWKQTDDLDVWKEANPLIGVMIPVENIERSRDVMRTPDFAREILGARLSA